MPWIMPLTPLILLEKNWPSLLHVFLNISFDNPVADLGQRPGGVTPLFWVNLSISNIQMEGTCQLTAMQAIANEGVTMVTSHGSPSPGTCHTEFSMENKYTCMDTGGHHEPRGRWEGANQRQSNKARQSKTTSRAKLHSNSTTMCAHGDCLLANSRSFQ